MAYIYKPYFTAVSVILKAVGGAIHVLNDGDVFRRFNLYFWQHNFLVRPRSVWIFMSSRTVRIDAGDFCFIWAELEQHNLPFNFSENK